MLTESDALTVAQVVDWFTAPVQAPPVATGADRISPALLKVLAQRYLLAALRLAHACGDSELATAVVSCLSYLAIWTNSPDAVIQVEDGSSMRRTVWRYLTWLCLICSMFGVFAFILDSRPGNNPYPDSVNAFRFIAVTSLFNAVVWAMMIGSRERPFKWREDEEPTSRLADYEQRQHEPLETDGDEDH
jgi:hypothetical protein